MFAGSWLRTLLLPLLMLPGVAMSVSAFTWWWLQGPPERYRSIDPESVTATLVKEESVVRSPLGAPIFEPGDRRNQSGRTMAGWFTVMAGALLLAEILSSRTRVRQWGVWLLVAMGAMQFVALLQIAYWLEILCLGFTMYVFPAAVTVVGAAIVLTALQLPAQVEARKLEGTTAPEITLAGLYLERAKVEALLEAVETRLGQEDKRWRFAGCVFAASCQPSLHLRGRRVQEKSHEGPLLELPGLMMLLTSQEEFLEWMAAALPTRSEAELDAASLERWLGLRSGLASILGNSQGVGLAGVVLYPFMPAAAARLLMERERSREGLRVEHPQKDLTRLAAQGVLKAAVASGVEVLLEAETENLCQDFAERMRVGPRRWRAWLTEGSPAAHLAEYRWAQRWGESEEFELEPQAPASALLPDFDRLDRELTRAIRPSR